MRSKWFAVGFAAIFVSTLGATGTQAAHADERPVAISFIDATALTLEYGQDWQFGFTGEDFAAYLYTFRGSPGNEEYFQVKTTGLPTGYNPVVHATNLPTFQGAIYRDYEKPPLGSGSYTFAIVIGGPFDEDTLKGATIPAAKLTVTPAAIGVEVRVIADAVNPANAIVTARFTGRFATEYQTSFYPNAALSPEGTWTIALTDSGGEVAVERAVDREAGDDTLATSFYWAEAKPGEQYTATAEFTPSGPTAANFATTPATPFEYTASSESRVIAASDAQEKPLAEVPPEPDFSVPLWWAILIGLALMALIAFAVGFAVRLGRSPVAISPSKSTIAGEL